MKSILEIIQDEKNKGVFTTLNSMVKTYEDSKTPLGVLIMNQLGITNFINFSDKKQQYDELITRYREDK